MCSITSILPTERDSHPQRHTYLKERRLLLAIRQDGACVGFVDYNASEAQIRFLWYALGHRAVGQELLDRTEQALREAGATSATAFDVPYLPFHKNLSDRLMHVRGLLTQNGYTLKGGEVYINWDHYVDALPQLHQQGTLPEGVKLRVEEIALDLTRLKSGVRPDRAAYATLPERDQPTQGVGTEVTAVAADGELLGICRTVPANDYDASPALSSTCFVAWLGVPPDGGPHDERRTGQGLGLGKRLLSQALVQMQRRGFVNSIISTAYSNFRAQIFYTNFGYSVSDWTHSFSKDLSAAGNELVRPRL